MKNLTSKEKPMIPKFLIQLQESQYKHKLTGNYIVHTQEPYFIAEIVTNQDKTSLTLGEKNIISKNADSNQLIEAMSEAILLINNWKVESLDK